MHLVLRFANGASLAAVLRENNERGGVLVKAEMTLDSGAALEVTVDVSGRTASTTATFIQALGSHGIAIALRKDDEAVASLAADDGGAVSAPTAEVTDDAPAAAEPERPRRATRASQSDMPVRERIKVATKSERIQMALYGTRPERNLLIRERDKSIHQYVIRSPKIGLDEVATIARMGSVAPDVLHFIAQKREWFQRPDIAAALVRNPKFPVGAAKKLLNFVSPRELRQLAKGAGVRDAIAQEARRRVLKK